MIKEELIKIVGLTNILDNPEVLESYQRDLSLTDTLKPALVVKPRDTNEIKSIISLANKAFTPVIPISSGAPHFRGDTVPGKEGAIIVDLSGLKNVINIDRDYRVAMFEPGITFGELIPEVAKQGLRLNMPLLPRQSKSVVASALEREPVTMPTYHWDIADPLNCVEVIGGSGEIFRTGGAAGPGSIEEQWVAGQAQNEAAGPTQASWHRMIQGAQGTLGIVTWASLRCEITPKLERPFVVGSQNLSRIIDLVHWLIRLRLVNECFVLNNISLPLLLPRESDIDKKTASSLPAWILFFNIAGYNYLPEERIGYMVKEMERLAKRSDLRPSTKIGSIEADDVLAAVKKPSGEPYWKLRPRGAFEEIAFITKYSKIDGLADIMHTAARAAGVSSSNLGAYIQPIVQGVNCHCEYNLFYDHLNAKEAAVVKKLAADVIPLLIDKGAFFSRPYGQNAKLIYDRDPVTVKALKKVKQMFDPNNIMNPGKLCFR